MIVKTVSCEVYEGMHRVATCEDLNNGGYFDARGGAIKKKLGVAVAVDGSAEMVEV